jgi:ribosomal protein S1
LPGGIDGLVHLADISWDKLPADELVSNYSKGQEFDVIRYTYFVSNHFICAKVE